jgi:hypothetical protein
MGLSIESIEKGLANERITEGIISNWVLSELWNKVYFQVSDALRHLVIDERCQVFDAFIGWMVLVEEDDVVFVVW